ncbi:helix-turn-helix domain-containing protein [Streptomyces sp. NPDC008139]|uniref:helix-turn-helix domain-containing protein n=1 Tax=Streptomyces sp. NPDC008139 TaxID=3364814 RepID=UPI0036EB5143
MTDTAPPAAGPACARLAGALRDLRALTGLNLAALADRTPYSKSSWERYLNGKQLPPRQAVEALCATAREPPGRLVALWELADQEWSRRAARPAPPATAIPAPAPAGEREPSAPPSVPPGPAQGRRRRQWAIPAAVCAVGLTVAASLTALHRTSAGTSASPTASAAPPAAACEAHACAGREAMTMGCAMPGQEKILGRHRAPGGARLELVYSERCHAAWALAWHTRVGDVLQVSVPGDAPQRAEVTDTYDTESPLVTPMVDGSDLTGLQATFRPSSGPGTSFRR